MANEKSRNHEPTGANKGGNGQAQGKPDSDKKESAKKAKAGGSRSLPGPGKQPRDQLAAPKKSRSEAQASE